MTLSSGWVRSIDTPEITTAVRISPRAESVDWLSVRQGQEGRRSGLPVTWNDRAAMAASRIEAT